MFKKIVAALIALGTIGIGAVTASSLEEIRRDTHMLYRNGVAGCSTQFVKGNTFLTAEHCVTDKEATYSVKFVDKTKDGSINREVIFHLDIDEVDKKGDVATLKFRDSFYVGRGVDIATVEELASLPLGSRVISSGYPLEAEVYEHTFDEGIYNGLGPNPWPDEDEVTYATATGVRGSSGGGLYAKFGDEWKMIGTLKGKSTIANYVNYYSTVGSIHSLLD